MDTESLGEAHVERVEGVAKLGVAVDERQWRAIDATGGIELRDKRVEFGGVMELAATGVALDFGNAAAAIGKEDVHGNGRGERPDR